MFKAIKLSNLTIETPIFAAPLAGVTDRPFREILRKCEPTIPILTEMISSHSLVANQSGKKTNSNRNFDDYTNEGLIGAQIFGADPKIMADAAKIVEQNGAAWIDINMGCPVPKVATRAGAGAFLMRDHKLAGQIVNSVCKSVKIPVSVKTRLGWDNDQLDSDKLVCIAADNGAQFVTVHGRTRAAGYSGNADWEKIAKIQLSLNGKIPVIYNGDIKTESDIKILENLGANGAMIGRAMMGNPWIFAKLLNHKNNIKDSDLILEHLDKTIAYYGPSAGVLLFRKHAAWYAGGRPGAAAFRVLVNQISSGQEMASAIREFFIEK